MNVPEAVGVPEMVIVFAAHAAVTPAGKPAKVADVAPVVEKVMAVMAELIHKV